MVKDDKAIIVVPNEVNLGNDIKRLMEKAVFTKEELPEMVKLVDQEMKGEVDS
jgi:hypothetical protein